DLYECGTVSNDGAYEPGARSVSQSNYPTGIEPAGSIGQITSVSRDKEGRSQPAGVCNRVCCNCYSPWSHRRHVATVSICTPLIGTYCSLSRSWIRLESTQRCLPPAGCLAQSTIQRVILFPAKLLRQDFVLCLNDSHA